MNPATPPAANGAAVRVTPTRRSALPGDESIVVDPGAAAGSGGRSGGRAVIGAVTRDRGRVVVEVVVGGWRFELDVEPERRAMLRDRGTMSAVEGSPDGPLELRAIIPGRVASVAVAAGDEVDAGQELLVIEAMKMQNELRAPRQAAVARVAVVAGQTIELGELLVVLGSASETTAAADEP